MSRFSGKKVMSRMRAGASVRPGESIRIGFNLDRAVFFDPAGEWQIL